MQVEVSPVPVGAPDPVLVELADEPLDEPLDEPVEPPDADVLVPLPYALLVLEVVPEPFELLAGEVPQADTIIHTGTCMPMIPHDPRVNRQVRLPSAAAPAVRVSGQTVRALIELTPARTAREPLERA
jgi:hypothetical protein